MGSHDWLQEESCDNRDWNSVILVLGSQYSFLIWHKEGHSACYAVEIAEDPIDVAQILPFSLHV